MNMNDQEKKDSIEDLKAITKELDAIQRELIGTAINTFFHAKCKAESALANVQADTVTRYGAREMITDLSCGLESASNWLDTWATRCKTASRLAAKTLSKIEAE